MIRISWVEIPLKNPEMEPTLVVLAGPTAVGKTSLAIEIAEHFHTEILSADSRQVYRETTIGTAVPEPGQLARVPHHFIQTVSLTEAYNASIYEQQVLQLLDTLFRKKNPLLMVGGSGLYIHAACHGIDDLPSTDHRLRTHLKQRLAAEGLPSLTGELKSLDPLSHSRIDLQNPMRVLKALEVTLQTGIPYSSFLSEKPKKRPFRIVKAALHMDRGALYERINHRVDRMIEQGLLDEVEELKQYRGLNALKSVGYRELFRYLDGELALDEAVSLIKANTRRFARKQLTWFRKNNQYQWFGPEAPEPVIRWIESQFEAGGPQR